MVNYATGTKTPGILFVCEGNICRSPVGERVLAAFLGDRAVVSSAGTRAVRRSPISSPMAALLAEKDIDPSGFAARQLNYDILDESDLILTMTRWQKSWVLDENPGVLKRTFTLREFARIARGIDMQRLVPLHSDFTAYIGLAEQQRGRFRAEFLADDEIDDPYGRATNFYTEAFIAIENAVATLATSPSFTAALPA
jgi:protein-tyrosine phosphatase